MDTSEMASLFLQGLPHSLVCEVKARAKHHIEACERFPRETMHLEQIFNNAKAVIAVLPRSQRSPLASPTTPVDLILEELDFPSHSRIDYALRAKFDQFLTVLDTLDDEALFARYYQLAQRKIDNNSSSGTVSDITRGRSTPFRTSQRYTRPELAKAVPRLTCEEDDNTLTNADTGLSAASLAPPDPSKKFSKIVRIHVKEVVYPELSLRQRGAIARNLGVTHGLNPGLSLGQREAVARNLGCSLA